MSHVTRSTESCHAYERVTFEWVTPSPSESTRVTFLGSVSWTHVKMSHVTRTTKSCHAYEWVTSEWVTPSESTRVSFLGSIFKIHTWMSHTTQMNESCHAHKWVMSRTWMSRVTRVNELCHAYEWVMSRTWMSDAVGIDDKNESCHTYDWVVSRIWRSDIWMSDAVGIDGSRITMLRIPNSHMNESYHAYDWVMSHIWLSHVTHMNESYHAYDWVMSHIWWISDDVRFSSQTYKSRSDPESKRETQNNASSQISSVVREDIKHTRTNPQRKTVLCVGHTSFISANKTKKNTEVCDHSHKFESVTICDRHRCLNMSQMVTNLVWPVPCFMFYLFACFVWIRIGTALSC